MRIKNRTFDRVAIGKEQSRYWESKNNLNVWMRTIQDKTKKKKKKKKKRKKSMMTMQYVRKILHFYCFCD